MSTDRSSDLLEDIIDSIAFGDVAESVPAFVLLRRDDTSFEVDLGGPGAVYVVTVSRVDL